MKKWINIDISLLKTLLDEQAIAGLGVISQLSKQEYQEEFMSVQNVKKKLQTKKNNLTTKNRLSQCSRDLLVGTAIHRGCLQVQRGGKCCALDATQPKPPKNEKKENTLERCENHNQEWNDPLGYCFLCVAEEQAKDEALSVNNPLNNVGIKYDQNKPALAYIPKAALYAEGQAFAYGAKKYEPFNYRNGIAITRTLGAALRHIVQFLSGEDIDSESGVSHLGCARANIAMALDTLENHPELDDRFKGGKK